MSSRGTIEWTDATWNPKTVAYEQGFDRLKQPLRWKKPRRIFVCSMSDLFHDSVPDDFIAHVFGIMANAHWHTFQILTKRPERMRAWFRWAAAQQHEVSRWTITGTAPPSGWSLPNVCLGVSCEDQQRADERIPLLLQTPAAVRFVACEPLLGPLDLRRWLTCACHEYWPGQGHAAACPRRSLAWFIVGGEFGPGARPCDVAWIRSIRDQCKTAGMPCFVTQLGARPFVAEGSAEAELRIAQRMRVDDCGRVHLRDRKGADPSEWPEDLRVREWPEVRP